MGKNGKGTKKSKKKGGKRKQPVVVDPSKKRRRSHMLEVKQLAIELKDQGKKNLDIIEVIRKRFNLKVKSSSVATWYNKKNREKIRNMCVDHITGAEVRCN